MRACVGILTGILSGVLLVASSGVTAGAAAPDVSEDIRVHLVPLAELETLVANDGFLQALHVAPVMKLLLRRKRAGT